MRLVIVSDDKPGRKGLIAKHSFSVLVERDVELYLFGMGVDPDVLEHNARELGISLDIVDYAVISHEHLPHYGGFRYLSTEAPFTTVFIPYGTTESLGRLLQQSGLRPREVLFWSKVGEGVYISRPFYGPPYEHFMVIERGNELVVLAGCMHPGIKALQALSEFFKKKIYGVIGGFHLENAPDTVVEAYVDMLVNTVKPRLVAPLHCSGSRFVKKLKETGLVEVVDVSSGAELEL